MHSASLLWRFSKANQLRLETGHYVSLHTVFDTYAKNTLMLFSICWRRRFILLSCVLCARRNTAQKCVIDTAEQLLPELVSMVS
jgi:hypothetical protein